MASLSIRDVYKTYPNGVPVLKGVDIDIEDGQFLILVGGSGCGKSTLLNMIAGLETVTSGEIRIDGKVVNDLSPKDRDIAMVFQSYALYPSMTVRDNISFGLNIRKVPKNEQQQIVDRVSQMLQIQHLLDRKPGQLSGGQRQRVALARALAVRPRVLLLDEPLTALDAKLRDVLRREMNALLRELGVTTVYVTHDQAEAMELGDRIVVMGAGRIEQIGTPRDIYYRPASRTVAQFIGTLNRLAGQWRDGALVTTGGAIVTPHAADEWFFRPEDAQLADPAHAPLRGAVGACAFLGERTRLTIEQAAPEPIVIDVPGRIELARGTTVGIAIAAEGLIALGA